MKKLILRIESNKLNITEISKKKINKFRENFIHTKAQSDGKLTFFYK